MFVKSFSLLLLPLLACLGCSAGGGSHALRDQGPSGPQQYTPGLTEAVARELAFTRLVAVRFDGQSEAAGYLVEFDAVPLGIVDDRAYPVGTVIVKDADMRTVGFITPQQHAFAFDEKGRTLDRGYDTRDAQIQTLLEGTTRPRYTPVDPALVGHR